METVSEPTHPGPSFSGSSPGEGELRRREGAQWVSWGCPHFCPSPPHSVGIARRNPLGAQPRRWLPLNQPQGPGTEPGRGGHGAGAAGTRGSGGPRVGCREGDGRTLWLAFWSCTRRMGMESARCPKGPPQGEALPSPEGDHGPYLKGPLPGASATPLGSRANTGTKRDDTSSRSPSIGWPSRPQPRWGAGVPMLPPAHFHSQDCWALEARRPWECHQPLGGGRAGGQATWWTPPWAARYPLPSEVGG